MIELKDNGIKKSWAFSFVLLPLWYNFDNTTRSILKKSVKIRVIRVIRVLFFTGSTSRADQAVIQRLAGHADQPGGDGLVAVGALEGLFDQ